MLSKEDIKYFLANGFEHESSIEEMVIFISQNSTDPEILQAVRNMMKAWLDHGHVSYMKNLDIKDAEIQLEKFILKYLKGYL